MILYKPVVVSLVLSLMIAGLAVAQDAAKRPPTAAAAPANAAPAPSPSTPAPGTTSPEYRIGIDDVLDIAVWNNTTVSRTVPVRPDGKISLPLLNEVQAAGLTPSQLRQSLMSKLVEYMPTPEVSVIVREVHSNKISVLGEVRKAGRQLSRRQQTHATRTKIGKIKNARIQRDGGARHDARSYHVSEARP